MKACVDLGGTKLAVSLAADDVGAAGNALEASSAWRAQRIEPTTKTGGSDAVAAQILRLLAEACAAAGCTGADLTSLGVSSCGPFVQAQGMIAVANPNICGGLAGPARGLPNDWRSVALEAPLRQALPHLQDKLVIANDGIGALQAERRWGALQGVAHCAYVTWSTGVGFGLCVGGQVLRGKHGNAGHVGHSFVSDNDTALCGCGNLGDLESLVAGNALARRFAGTRYRDAAGLLTAAAAGDTEAVAVVDELCRVMGRALYNLVVTLDLSRISLGGSVFWHHQAYLLPRLQAQLRGKLPALTEGVELVPAGLGEQVGDFAALALTH